MQITCQSENVSGADNEQGRLTEVELAWIAGHFDGDGWVGIGKTKRHKTNILRYTPSTDLATTSELIAAHLISQYTKLGITVSVVRQSGRTPQRKDVIHVSTRSAISTKALLTAIHPHLIEKATQAKLVLDYIEWRENQPRQAETGKYAETIRLLLTADRRRGSPSTTTRLAPAA